MGTEGERIGTHRVAVLVFESYVTQEQEQQRFAGT